MTLPLTYSPFYSFHRCYTLPELWIKERRLCPLTAWVGNTVESLVLNFSCVSVASCCCCCCCQPQKSMRLWRRLGKSVMLKIWSTAVTHTAASPPQPHRPYWLIWVCVWGRGGLPAILGPLTLTLLPFGWMASLDTFFLFFLIVLSVTITFSLLFFDPFRNILLFSFHPRVSRSSPLLPVIISALKAALSRPTSSLSLLHRPLVCAFTL